MRKTKKLLALLLTLAMAMTMMLGTCITAFAEETTYTLTLNNEGKTDHTFEVYQVFTGDLSTDGKLSNIKWGTGITDAGKTALQNLYITDTTKDKNASNVAEAWGAEDANATAIAENISGYLTNTYETVSVSAGGTGTVSLAPGYYFVKDKAASQTGDNSAYTSYILKVVKDVTASTKLDVPTVEKKVKDANDTTGETSGWQDSADHDLGDTIEYQITGTLPTNYADYETYFYQFTDTMSKGLTYNNDSWDIKVGETSIKNLFTQNVVKAEDGTTTVTWTCDVTKEGDTYITKGLKENTTITKDSKIVVTYTCELNKDAVIGSEGNPNEVNLTYSNNPNKNGDGDHGTTPKDKNIVFTYELDVNKYADSVADTNKLNGATFKLEKKIKGVDGAEDTWELIGTISGTDSSLFAFQRLDDGIYKITETVTPQGYNTIEPFEVTITASHDETSDDPKLTELKMTRDTSNINGDLTSGKVSTDVINKSGSTLPSTGGIGTKLFYVIGGILVLGAGILLVARRKMDA